MRMLEVWVLSRMDTKGTRGGSIRADLGRSLDDGYGLGEGLKVGKRFGILWKPRGWLLQGTGNQVRLGLWLWNLA